MSYYYIKEERRFELRLRFRDGAPSDAVCKIMEENGFHQKPDIAKGGQFDVPGGWVHTVPLKAKARDRIVIEGVYQLVTDMIRKEKGVPPKLDRSRC